MKRRWKIDCASFEKFLLLYQVTQLLESREVWLQLEMGDFVRVQGEMVKFIALPFLCLSQLKIRLFTVLYFFRKIIEIESFALRAAILHEWQNFLGGGGGLGGSEKNFLAPPPWSYNPRRPPKR